MRQTILAVALLAALVACNNDASKSVAKAPAAASSFAAAPPPPPESRAEDKAAGVAEANQDAANAPATRAVSEAPTTAAQITSSAATYTDAQRKFIRTAHASFRVKDVYQSALAIEDIAAAQGGFTISNDIGAQTLGSQTRPEGDGKLLELTEYTLRGNLTVRVPSEHTQAFLRAIVGQIDFLDERKFDATDAQFDLLRQQLAWQRGQESAHEIAQAVQQGGKLIAKTEALQGADAARAARDEALIAQKQFEDKVAFSTIDLSMYQPSKIRATELVDTQEIFRQNAPGFFTRLGESLRGGWYGLLDLVLELMAVWPLWVVIAAAFWGVIAFRRKKPAAE
jgi:hypothetical protein